jgi:Mrp family chromosome partitioning ATPase
VAVPDIDRLGRLAQGAPKPAREGRGLAPVSGEMLEACRAASLLIGGPRLRNLGVTSSVREEGRTSIALAMAAVHREDYGRNVVLVDMDFENPTLARRHDLDPWPGLAELARGEARLDEVLQPVADGIRLIAAGAIADTATRSATEIVKRGLLERIQGEADVVIGDLPPLLGGGPGAAAARAFESLLLVVRAGVTPVARVKEAAADLHVTPNVLLNGAYSSLPLWLRRVVGR